MMSKSKLYIIGIVAFQIIFSIFLIFVILFVIAYPLKLTHLVLFIIIVPVYAVTAYMIYVRIKKNSLEKQMRTESFDEYLTVRDILRNSGLLKKERAEILKKLANEFICLQNSGDIKKYLELFEPNEYAKIQIREVGYKNLLVISLLDKAFLSTIIIFLMQFHNYVSINGGTGLYKITLFPFNILVVIVACYIGTFLHDRLIKKERYFWAGAVPLILTATYFGIYFGLSAIDFEGKIMNYILGGNFVFISNALGAVIFSVLLLAYAALKTVFFVKKRKNMRTL